MVVKKLRKIYKTRKLRDRSQKYEVKKEREFTDEQQMSELKEHEQQEETVNYTEQRTKKLIVRAKKKIFVKRKAVSKAITESSPRSPRNKKDIKETAELHDILQNVHFYRNEAAQSYGQESENNKINANSVSLQPTDHKTPQKETAGKQNESD